MLSYYPEILSILNYSYIQVSFGPLAHSLGPFACPIHLAPLSVGDGALGFGRAK